MNRNYAFLLVFLALFACENYKCKVDPEIAALPVEVAIERKEASLFQAKSVSDLQVFLQENPTLASYFLDVDQYPNDSVLASQMFKMVPYLDSLEMEVDKKFGDISWLEERYRSAFQHLMYYYPNSITPRVETMVTAFYRDIYFSDSLFIIGLDFFIGNDTKFKPNNVPAYISRRFTPDYIVPASFFFLSDYYNKVDMGDNTLLNEMITAGKTFYFTQRMMPCLADSVLIGFSAEELAEVHKNEDVVWANFIQNQLLYETEPKLVNKFMGERPNVYEIGEKCPGRIGAWVGWEIVKSYMVNNPKVTLQELMEEDDPKKIFTLSKYRPNPH